jgi:hypothetical protein
VAERETGEVEQVGDVSRGGEDAKMEAAREQGGGGWKEGRGHQHLGGLIE